MMQEQKYNFKGVDYLVRELNGQFQFEIVFNGFISGWTEDEMFLHKNCRQWITDHFS
jgi:hypothetical protein